MLCSAQNPKLNKQFASGFAVASLFARFRAPDTQKYHYRREPRCC